MQKSKLRSIVLVGGGTGGATTPLIAIAEQLRATHPDVTLAFIGTSDGIERKLANTAAITFFAIKAGKFRRYFSLQNLSDVVAICVGFFQAFRLLGKIQPAVIVSVGSYVAVPVVWAGKLRGIPIVVHQQDVVPGLSNKLCAPHARVITTVFEETLRFFPKEKAVWTGNPVRSSILITSHEQGIDKFNFSRQSPVLLVIGGGTGSLRINQLVNESLSALLSTFQIIHFTGGRMSGDEVQENPRYRRFDFLAGDIQFALAAADIVVCRAGLATLSELGALGKPSIVVPMPNSHQEANADFFARQNACVVLDERKLTAPSLTNEIQALWHDKEKRKRLSQNIRSLVRIDATERVCDEIMNVLRDDSLRDVMRDLSRAVRDIRRNEPLSRHSNFKIGGPTDIFASCATAQELYDAIGIVRRYQTPYVVLGGGTNVVVSDQGFRGVVIHAHNNECSVAGETITVGAGMTNGAFVQQCHAHGLVGAEFIVGIYGTIGGAVRGNAGSFGKEMKDIVTSCEVLTEQGEHETWPNSSFKFGYRDSIVKRSGVVIVSVKFHLTRGDVAEAQRTLREYLTYKRAHQPINLPSAGCMFKNVVVPKDNVKVRTAFSTMIKDDTLPAWAFIKEVELAGKRIGDIQISEQHANFFVNLGNGTAEQIMQLKSLVKQRVRDSYGIQLEEEVQFIGF